MHLWPRDVVACLWGKTDRLPDQSNLKQLLNKIDQNLENWLQRDTRAL